jgi:hypothetical protein
VGGCDEVQADRTMDADAVTDGDDAQGDSNRQRIEDVAAVAVSPLAGGGQSRPTPPAKRPRVR